jgi:cytochrome bd-type quinol oxidase subunit 2
MNVKDAVLGIIFALVTVLIGIALLPTLMSQTSIITGNATYVKAFPATTSLVVILPLLFVVLIIMAIFFFFNKE